MRLIVLIVAQGRDGAVQRLGAEEGGPGPLSVRGDPASLHVLHRRSAAAFGRDPQRFQLSQRDRRHLQPGGVAAQIRRGDEAEAEDPDAATGEGADVTESTVVQAHQLQRLG